MVGYKLKGIGSLLLALATAMCGYMSYRVWMTGKMPSYKLSDDRSQVTLSHDDYQYSTNTLVLSWATFTALAILLGLYTFGVLIF